MTRSGLTGAQIDEVLAVLNNHRQSDFATGSIRVKGLSRPALNFLKSRGFVAKSKDGKYYPQDSRSSLYPIFSIDWIWLPPDILWHVVSPMLTDGHAGYSITAHRNWGLLNIYRRGEHGFRPADEDHMTRILLEIAAYGYIWFQFGGSIWCIDERKDQVAA